MKKALLKIAAILALSSTVLSFGVSASAAPAESGGSEVSAYSRSIDERTQRTEYALRSISAKGTWNYPTVAVSYNGSNLGNIGRRINDEVYIPIRRFSESVGSGTVSYNSAQRRITITGQGHNISVSDGAYALYASGRVFFSKTPSVILSDGRMYVPAAALAKAFSLNFSESSGGAVMSGTAKAVVSGDKYYAEDAVYWLSRIISAESRGEPLIGQLAVGNIILNRVRSSAYPNTIWGVIFDKKYGVQFSPVANGTIYNTPTSTCIMAAKICLEGFSVSEDILYFLAPSGTGASWIEKNRQYAFSIGRHDFYY